MFLRNLFSATIATAVMAFISIETQAQTIIPIDPEWPPIIEEPFEFLGPDSAGLAFAPNSPVLLKWNIGSTNPNHRVQVKFSDDNGQTFNHLLAAGVPITEKQVWVVLPKVNTNWGRFRLMATGSGDSTRTDVSSNPVTLSSSIICKPSEMISSGGFISNVRILNAAGSVLFSNPSLNFINTGFVDYVGSTPIPNLLRSTSTSTPSFNIEVTTAGVSSGQPKNVAIWIDYNNDNQFASTGPEFLGTFSATTGTLFRRSFSIPSNVTAGQKRLRVRLVQNTIYNISGGAACLVNFQALSPTSTTMSGETEDYVINVTSSTLSGRMAAEEIQAPFSQVFPNPVRSNDHPGVLISGFGQTPVHINLTDLNGKVLQTELSEGDGLVKFRAGIPRGFYLIQVISADATQIHKLLVE